jgi:hypothetical protein
LVGERKLILCEKISIKSIAWRTYIYFAVFNSAFIPLIWFFYPETRNLSLEQVDRLFTGDKVLLHWKPSMGERQGSFAVEAVSEESIVQDGEKQIDIQHHESKTVQG